jgi:hypothetical protein
MRELKNFEISGSTNLIFIHKTQLCPKKNAAIYGFLGQQKDNTIFESEKGAEF